ncbi:MAG: hypothetical protein PHF24_01355 [Syntrophomonas sp.]|nr:hypothetical protein [Syntrophomonas sp.]
MSYNLVLDEPAKNDKVEEHDGLHFVIDNNLLEMSQGFTISSIQQGGQTYFNIIPEKESASDAGCSSCNSCS